jgi:hypothetical protein
MQQIDAFYLKRSVVLFGGGGGLNGSGLGFLVFLLEKVIITGEQFR